jgi:hypothetical protein
VPLVALSQLAAIRRLLRDREAAALPYGKHSQFAP